MFENSLILGLVNSAVLTALSLSVTYIPGAEREWNSLTGNEKRKVVFGTSCIVSMLLVALSCNGLLNVPCQDGFWQTLASTISIIAIGSSVNQGVYSLFPRKELESLMDFDEDPYNE